MTLTLKQARLAAEYIVDLNGRKAAIRARYSAKTAEVQASRLLRKATAQTAVEEAMQARSGRTGIKADRVVLEVGELVFSNITCRSGTGSSKLPISTEPRSRYSNRSPTSCRVAPVISGPFGSANPCRRAARLGVSPRRHSMSAYVAPASVIRSPT